LIGPALVRSQGPHATRKHKTAAWAHPAIGNIGSDVVSRFATQQRELETWVRGLDDGLAGRTIMESPFQRAIIYSVSDACRLVLAHDHRHLEQACRVKDAPDFPRA
jgi:hypothetical protein